MKIFRSLESISNWPQSSVICLGNFDGFHRGHQALIGQLIDLGKGRELSTVVMTFDPHPKTVLRPELDYKALFTREDLFRQLSHLALDMLVLQAFTLEFSKLTPREFFLKYLLPFKPVDVVVGHDFGFGHNREGSIEVLKELSALYNFNVHLVPPVTIDGQVISTTRIRSFVEQGQMELAREFLGRPFSRSGVVESGAGRGQKLGVATANITFAGLVKPKRGVYVSTVRFDNQQWPAVTNFGVAPTFNSDGQNEIVETHILDQDFDLRKKEIEVDFWRYLREEKKFSNSEELIRQIQNDMAITRQFWTSLK